jgi:L-iditol 2-dehydrogenase
MGEQMRRFQKLSPEPGHAGVTVGDTPEPGPGEALVRISGCGICGSDLHTVRADPGYDWIATPVVIGHECSGTVAAVGPGCRRLAPGDPVVAVSIQGCGACDVCVTGTTQLCPDRQILGLHRDGVMADYAVIAERHLVRVPDGLDLDVAALTEPLSVAVHALLGRTAVGPGTRAVVSGPGTIGLLCAQVARACGAEVLLTGARQDTERRLPIGERLGLGVADIETTPASDAVRRRFGGAAPDVWVEASGAVPALDAAVRAVRPGGQVTVVAMFAKPYSFLPTDIVRREVSLVATYAAGVADYSAALRLLANGSVDVAPLIDRYPLDQAPRAFDDAAAGRAVKPLIVTR